jgi:integrase
MNGKPRVEKKHRGVFEKDAGSGIWWIRYFADGQKKREKVGRKSDAIALYQQRKSEVRAGAKMPANMRFKGETLTAVIDRALEWYGSHRPKQLYDATIHLEAFREDFGTRIAESITPDDIDVWLGSHDEDWSPATMNRYKTSLSRALQLALVSGHVTRNVARLIPSRQENNKRVRWLKDDEEKRIVETIQKNCPTQLPAFMVALHTGMRKGEQFSLEWSNVDLERRKIFLGNTKSKSKEGRYREIPMSDTCHRMLAELFEKRKKQDEPNQWVFQSTRYDQRLLDPKKWFETVLRDAKVDDFHWHDARHTFCSRLVMKGVSLRAVMELAGHSSIVVTTRYAHLAPEHNVTAIKLLDA